MLTFKQYFSEDVGGAVSAGGAPANNVSGGHVAGLGVGPQGEPGGPNSILGRKKRPLKRSSPVLTSEQLDLA